MVVDLKENFHPENYGIFAKLLEDGIITVNTNDWNSENLEEYFTDIYNILCDGIELPEVQQLKVHVVFADGEDAVLSIFDFLYNLIFATLIVKTGKKFTSDKIWFEEDISQSVIAKYIDDNYVRYERTRLPFMELNENIDIIFEKFRRIRNFQLWEANTMNFKDTLDLMNKYPEFNDTMHFNVKGLTLENAKQAALAATDTQLKYIADPANGHCLMDSVRTGEGLNKKQFSEVATNLSVKPDGNGSVYPYIIPTSFMNGGLNTDESLIIESNVGRQAQILAKTNVGVSGAFSRILGLNNQDTFLNPDPNYSCDTKNFEIVTIDNDEMLKAYDMRYYKTNPQGIDHLIDYDNDKFLIGKTIFLRSPMTCASAARGHGICYKCYGNLAFVNRDIGPGKMAAEHLGSRYTQRLLSAKHLLEAKVLGMIWSEPFKDIFTVDFNTIHCKEEDEFDYSNWYLQIDTSEDSFFQEDDMDETSEYNMYVEEFNVIDPEGKTYSIHTQDSDPIYIQAELYSIIQDRLKTMNEDETVVTIPMTELQNVLTLFIVNVKNNELSATMNKVKNIINNNKETSKYDRNSILREFLLTNYKGGIKLASVHFEVLLMNQMRYDKDINQMPDWTVPHSPEDPGYQILTLNKALAENPSITVRMQYSKLSKTLFNPSTFKMTKASVYDLYSMTNPTSIIANKDGLVENVDDKLIATNDEEDTKVPVTWWSESSLALEHWYNVHGMYSKARKV